MTYEKGIPDYAMVPAKEMEERITIPITKGAIYSPIQVTNITEKPKTVITLEEDILVPDIKPDLREILLVDGKSYLANREIDQIVKGDDYINLSGEVELQTLYTPEKQEGSGPIIAVQSRVPFKDQWHTPLAPGATLVLDCSIEKIEYMVINERKFRVKIMLAIMAREYTDTKADIFEGLLDENIQTLKRNVEISSIAFRKKDSLPIREDLFPKEDSRPQSILKQDLNIVENYKQVTADKVVINGFVYVSVFYSCLSDSSEDMTENLRQIQERIEFTQFIPIQQGGNQNGCNVCFDDSQLRVKLTQDEGGNDVFRLEGELLTFLELFRNTEKEIIVDGYHMQKNFVCDFEEITGRTLIGTSTGESSVREIISLESSGCEADRILYACGHILQAESHSEQGKIITEGTILVKMICVSSQDGPGIFSLKQEVSFRVVASMPGLTGGEIISHKIYIKDIWTEKINAKQLEFNASIMVSAEILRPTPFKILINPAFEESLSMSEIPPMAIYICKPEDSLWQISKRFKTTMASVMQINELQEDSLKDGQKLLIIK